MSHIGWRYFSNPWGKFNSRWWSHWLKLDRLWMDIKDAFERAFKGYARCDIYDLCSYHAGVTLGLLEHYQKNHGGYPGGMTEEEYDAKIAVAVDAWRAKVELLNDSWCDRAKEIALEKRWEAGYPTFIEIYDSLWN